MTAALLSLEGRLGAKGVLPWICHRARLLDLRGRVWRRSASAVDILVVGPAPLVDAMEVACSLGPGEALVETLARRSFAADPPPGRFEIAQSDADCQIFRQS